MQINNHTNLYPGTQSLGFTKAGTETGLSPATHDSKNNALSVTLSASGASANSTAAIAVAQYEAMVQQNGTSPSPQEKKGTGNGPVEAATLSSLPQIKTFNEADVRA